MDNDYKIRQELQELSDKFIDEQLKNEKLQFDLNEMTKNYDEKCEIVSILRQQIAEFTSGLNEIETSHETLKSQNDNLRKRNSKLEEENKALNDLVSTLKNENENLNERFESRTQQTSDLAMKLMGAKVELEEKTNELSLNQKEIETLKRTVAEHLNKRPVENEELSEEIYNLQSKNNALTKQLKELLLERKKVTKQQTIKEQTEEKEEPIEELYNLRAKVKALSHQLSERSLNEDISNLKSELQITETSWKMEKAHKERYARENANLGRTLNELNKKFKQMEEENQNLKDKLSTRRLPINNMPIADEVGEIMDSTTLQKKRPMHDPLERVNELARRNKLQKPLHQSSYALELETFNKMDISDEEIRRGNLKQRTALADHSNHRKVAAKPMAFTINF